jgi:predicted secreted hydrolase
MHVVHTAGLPPNQGRMKRAMRGCTKKRRNAPAAAVSAKASLVTSDADPSTGGAGSLTAADGPRYSPASMDAAMHAGAPWRRYPYVLVPGDPELTFPAAEGDQGAASNTYYLAGRLRGLASGRRWAYLVVFTFNAVRRWLRSDFYTFALFDLGGGRYGSYTEHDLPRLLRRRRGHKLSVASGRLDVAFASALGPCRWTTRRTADGSLVPFAYRLTLRGRDAAGQAMRLDVDADPGKPPLPVGGAQYAGSKTCLGQYGTHSYFQSDVRTRGTLGWGEIEEEVEGDAGWIDRQWTPRHLGVHQDLRSTRYRHEWRQLHLDNGVELSVWLQVDRRRHDRPIPFSGATAADPAGEALATTEVTVDRLSFVRDPGLVRPRLALTRGARYFADAYRLRIPPWDVDVRSEPLVAAPAHAFPIEYWSGPTRLHGTMQGRPVSGFGFHERTHAFVRDFELVDVLRATLRHLPPEVFPPGGPGPAAAADLAWEVDAFLSHGDRRAARRHLAARVRPLLERLRDDVRGHVLGIAADLDAAL